MALSVREYGKMLADMNVSVLYSGPIWDGVIASLADMLQKRFEYDELPRTTSQKISSIFVEQVTNILMYSAEKERVERGQSGPQDVSKGVFMFGMKGKTYFLETGNVVLKSSAAILKARIDHLNALNKEELRKYHMERAMSVNDNPESKGAGIGLIEIAKRAKSKIEYQLEPLDDGLFYFTMHVTI